MTLATIVGIPLKGTRKKNHRSYFAVSLAAERNFIITLNFMWSNIQCIIPGCQLFRCQTIWSSYVRISVLEPNEWFKRVPHSNIGNRNWAYQFEGVGSGQRCRPVQNQEAHPTAQADERILWPCGKYNTHRKYIRAYDCTRLLLTAGHTEMANKISLGC